MGHRHRRRKKKFKTVTVTECFYANDTPMHPSFYITKDEDGKEWLHTKEGGGCVTVTEVDTQRGRIDDIVNGVQPLEAVTIGGVKPDKNNYLLNMLGAVSIQDKDALMPANIKLGDKELTPSTVFLQNDMETYKNAIEENFAADRTRITAIEDGTNNSTNCLSQHNHRKQGWLLQQSRVT